MCNFVELEKKNTHDNFLQTKQPFFIGPMTVRAVMSSKLVEGKASGSIPGQTCPSNRSKLSVLFPEDRVNT